MMMKATTLAGIAALALAGTACSETPAETSSAPAVEDDGFNLPDFSTAPLDSGTDDGFNLGEPILGETGVTDGFNLSTLPATRAELDVIPGLEETETPEDDGVLRLDP